MPLTDIAIRNAKPMSKPIKIFDGGGLYLLISPKGGKWWRLQYRFAGKPNTLSMGIYPDIGLREARERRDAARKLLAHGVDPGEHRKATKAAKAERGANTFEVIAREWIEKQSVQRWTASNRKKVTKRLENDAFPWLGKRPVEDITTPELLKVLERIEQRGTADTAHRVLQTCGQVFRYAVASGRMRYNPCPDLKGALTPVKKQHLAAITDPEKVGPLMRAIRSYEGEYVVRYALRLAPLVFVRPGELRGARWSEFDLKESLWTIPAERMKMKTQDHLVPLSRQALTILEEIHPLTGRRELVFPGTLTSRRPISDNTVNAALRRMGFPREEMTGHGFRAMARTLLDERLHVRPDYIEHQLAHAVRDPNGRAYNRTAHLEERRRMMQQWADYLDELADSKNLANIAN